MSRHTLDVLYKLTVRSTIDYALPVYCNTLTKSELSCLENLQYRAAKLVTGTFHLTSREKLNFELGWETIKQRSDNLSLNIFTKFTCMKPGLWLGAACLDEIWKINSIQDQRGDIFPSKI